MSPQCTLWPSGEVLELNTEESLLAQLKKAGKNIKSSCGGCATCGDCVIIVKSGEMNLSPQNFEELRLLGNVFLITKERLSCQTKITGDITIDISAHQKYTQNKQTPPIQKKANVIRKKREEIDQQKKAEEQFPDKTTSPDWYRHWEKEGEGSDRPKKLGGNKRPKPFSYSDSDNDKE